MVDEIRQDLGFNAQSALNTLRELDGAMARLESRLTSTASALGKFNAAAGSDKALASFSKLGTVGPQAMQQLAQTGQRSTTQLRSAWEELISVHGRYSTSLALFGRITFTQLAIRGLRLTETAFKDAIQASLAFQRQLAEIQSLAEGSIGSTEQLSGQLRAISSEFNVPLSQVATATYEGLSQQLIRTSGDMRLLETTAKFTRATLTDMGDSTKLLTSTMNAFNLPMSEAERLASKFFTVIDRGSIRGRELADSFGTVNSLANAVGVSIDELGAGFIVLTRNGLEHNEAATQLRGILSGLLKPTPELTKALRAMGFETARAAVAAEGFGGLLAKLEATTNGNAETFAKLFPNVRALAGGFGITGKNAQVFADELQRLQNVSGSLISDKAMQVMASNAEQLQQKFNRLKNDLIPLGDAFVTIANTGLEGAGVLRDFSVAALDTVGSLIRLQPRVSEFGNAWQSLQALFGKDLTIGDFGGKIVSELEIRQRQLEVIARKREEDTAAQIKQQEQVNAQLNTLKFKEIDNAREANKLLQVEAQAAADRLVQVEKHKLAELTKQLRNSEQLIRDSRTRVAELNTRLDERQFRGQIADLSSPQQALALLQRSQALASQATTAMEQAGRSGNQLALQRARSLFDAANSTAEEAQQVASAAGAKDRERQAAAALVDITRQQISSEQRLASISAARLPQLDQQHAKQKDNLATIEAATKSLVANSSIFDKTGKQLSLDDAQKSAEARVAALKQLLDAGVPKQKVIELQFRTQDSLVQLASQLQSKLDQIDATPFQTAQAAMQNSVASANAIADAFQRAAAAAGRLNVPTPTPVNRVFGGRMNYLAAGGQPRGIDTIPVMASPGEMFINAKSTRQFFSQLQAMNAGMQPTFRQAGGNVTLNVGDGAIHVSGASAPQQTAREIARALKREFARRGGGAL